MFCPYYVREVKIVKSVSFDLQNSLARLCKSKGLRTKKPALPEHNDRCPCSRYPDSRR